MKEVKQACDDYCASSIVPPVYHMPTGACSAIQDYLLKLTGARSVPRVFIGGKCIGGGSETRALHDQGKLIPMLKECGAL